MKSKVLEDISPVTEKELCVYHSIEDKPRKLADAYAETDQLSHRYLAYRDLPFLIKNYVNGNRALDYGSGTGISTDFLKKLGLEVTGADINLCMIEKAREVFPDISFLSINQLMPSNQFDLIFSSFVLFDFRSKQEIINYLKIANSLMKQNGLMIVITGSEELYSPDKKWTAFDSDFVENQNLQSGDLTRLRLKHPPIEFRDYFWREHDYDECFQSANLQILKVHKPKGTKTDPYLWEDETEFAPFTIYILQKQKD